MTGDSIVNGLKKTDNNNNTAYAERIRIDRESEANHDLIR
jgi:hypothetical protein